MHFTTFSLFLVSVLVGLSKTSLDHNQFTEKTHFWFLYFINLILYLFQEGYIQPEAETTSSSPIADL